MKRLLSIILMFSTLFSMATICQAEETTPVQSIVVVADDKEGQQRFPVINKDGVFYAKFSDVAKLTRFSIKEDANQILLVLGLKSLKVDTSNNTLFVNNAKQKFSGIHRFNGEVYVSMAEILPWLNTVCYEKDGILYVGSDQMSFWEVYKDFEPMEYYYMLSDNIGKGNAGTFVNIMYSTFNMFLNFTDWQRYVSADGIGRITTGNTMLDYETYLECFKEFSRNPSLNKDVVSKFLGDLNTKGKMVASIVKPIYDTEKSKPDYGVAFNPVIFEEHYQTVKVVTSSIKYSSQLYDYLSAIKNSMEGYADTFTYVYDNRTTNANSAELKAARQAKKIFEDNILEVKDIGKMLIDNAMKESIPKIGNLAKDYAGKKIQEKFGEEVLKNVSKATWFTKYTGLIDATLSATWPINKAAKEISKLGVYTTIQSRALDSYFAYANTRTASESDIRAACLSAILYLKAAKKSYEAEDTLYSRFGGEGIFDLKYQQIDEQILRFMYCLNVAADDAINDKSKEDEYISGLLAKLNIGTVEEHTLNLEEAVDLVIKKYAQDSKFEIDEAYDMLYPNNVWENEEIYYISIKVEQEMGGWLAFYAVYKHTNDIIFISEGNGIDNAQEKFLKESQIMNNSIAKWTYNRWNKKWEKGYH